MPLTCVYESFRMKNGHLLKRILRPEDLYSYVLRSFSDIISFFVLLKSQQQPRISRLRGLCHDIENVRGELKRLESLEHQNIPRLDDLSYDIENAQVQSCEYLDIGIWPPHLSKVATKRRVGSHGQHHYRFPESLQP